MVIVCGKEILFRKLGSDDAPEYSRLRTEAITGPDKRNYYIDPSEELSRTEDDWRKVCTETCERAIFGAFDKEELVGAMSVSIWDGDHDGKTSYFRAAYIKKELRHSPVAKCLLNMMYDWSKEHGCQDAIYAIRDDLIEWKNNQIKNGAVEDHREPLRYDGQYANAVWYRRALG